MILVSKEDIRRHIHQTDLAEYVGAGWTTVQPYNKKKKSEKTAEQAPEAAQEDQGNDITQGE